LYHSVVEKLNFMHENTIESNFIWIELQLI